jgi:DNA-binding response OmpR family regulator
MAALERPDLILLDVVLSGAMDGYEVARRVREFSDVPIIMLTAKARESDLLHGFDVGADDYLTKPFSSKELLVRVRAVLKRAHRETRAETEIICGELRIDMARRHVSVGGREIQLTPTEYSLLLQLHPQPGDAPRTTPQCRMGREYRDDVDYLQHHPLPSPKLDPTGRPNDCDHGCRLYLICQMAGDQALRLPRAASR